MRSVKFEVLDLNALNTSHYFQFSGEMMVEVERKKRVGEIEEEIKKIEKEMEEILNRENDDKEPDMLMELVDEWFKEAVLENILKGFGWIEGVGIGG
jgi:type II secretory ATPase GspE/PulE/Tfp pilus assembly ATPase PilB-like protein